jgi:uncharacterized protein YdeI (YjbR/CyaY-like superfamily)
VTKKPPATALSTLEASTLAEWRVWLSANHGTQESVWLVAFKKGSGLATFTLDEAVEEALCWGWIDSLPRKLDEQRSMLLFSPRKPNSLWSAVNKRRVERLTVEGRMQPPGLAKVEAAKASGTWFALDGVEALEIPPDLADAFAAHPGAQALFEAFPRSAKRGILEWILQARTPATRARRVRETAEKAAQGERANQWRKPDP